MKSSNHGERSSNSLVVLCTFALINILGMNLMQDTTMAMKKQQKGETISNNEINVQKLSKIIQNILFADSLIVVNEYCLCRKPNTKSSPSHHHVYGCDKNPNDSLDGPRNHRFFYRAPTCSMVKSPRDKLRPRLTSGGL